jgi:hypothetical protein
VVSLKPNKEAYLKNEGKVCYIEELWEVKKTTVEWQLDLKHEFIYGPVRGTLGCDKDQNPLGYTEKKMCGKEIILSNHFK